MTESGPEEIISAGPAAGLPEGESDDLDSSGAEAELDGEWREGPVPVSHHAERLDLALAALVPEFSRTYLQQLIEGGAVRLNGQPAGKPSAKVKAGQLMQIELRPTPQSQAFKPEAMALEVVHEDAHLLVVNKPAGLVVHPAPGNWSGTLLNGLLAHHAQARFLPRAGIVHRLDKDTSGLMVVAKTRETMDALVAMIAERTVSREYVALAHGEWDGPRQRRVDQALGRDPRHRTRMAVVDLERHSGKSAVTDFTLLDGTDETPVSLVRCKLHTGRTHQIRVHMAFLGHPLLADEIYGGKPLAGLTRQALHAWRLGFVHPVTGEALRLKSEPPADMAAALDELGLRYNENS